MSFKGIGIRIFALILGVIVIIAGVYINFFQTKGFEKTTAIITSIEETEDAKTQQRTHDKDLAAGGSAIKKSTPYGVLFLRAIDGARTRGLDLGKVARYQLRHYRIYVKSLARQQ